MKHDKLVNANTLWADIMMLPHNGDLISSKEVEQVIKDSLIMDAVSRGVLDQVRWERDVAMQQLEEHGIPFCGIAPDVINVVRCKNCKYSRPTEWYRAKLKCCHSSHGCSQVPYEVPKEHFCSYGERRD